MRKIIFLSLFVCGLCIPAFSQTNAEKLEEAVKMYNTNRDFIDGKNAETLTVADIQKVEAEQADAAVLLDEIRTNGTAEEAKAARYFAANFIYNIGFAYGKIGKNRDAYAFLNKIKPEFEFFSNSANFPLVYKFDSKNYSIQFTNFTPVLAEYYAGMAEICYNIGKYDESIGWSQKSIESPFGSQWYKYIALNSIVKSKEKNREWDKELLDYALQQITICAQLDTASLRTIDQYNYPTALLGAEKIETTLQKRPELAAGEYHRGTAAPLLVKAKKYRKALSFYQFALEAGFAKYDKAYLFEAATFALTEESNSVALLALDQLYTNNSSSFSCYEWEKLSELYGKAGNSGRKNDCSAKASACQKKQKKEAKRNESGGVGFGIYAGVYPLALATRFNRYRDYGGVVGILLGKMAIEGSYKMINRNFIATDDLYFKQIEQESPYYWDGYRAHIAFKFYPEKNSSSQHFHIGPLFEMVNRTIEPISSDVFNKSTGVMVAQDKTFYAREKSYNLFFNYGLQTYEKGFYFDSFLGFGVSYSKFEAGAEYNDGEHTFSDILLENRKDTRFGVMIRTGIIIGFGLVKR